MGDPSRARVAGPLRQYAPGFAGELARLGCTSESAYGQMLVMAHLSRWLAGEGLDAPGLTSLVAERFLAARRAAGYTLYLSPKALVPLLGYLRRLDAAPQAAAPGLAGAGGARVDRQAGVTPVIVVTCPSTRKGTAKLAVTALRSLLGWLPGVGEIGGPLAWAVP